MSFIFRFSILLALLLTPPVLLPARQNDNRVEASVVVLCYHSFIGRETISTDFSVQDLKAHAEVLAKNGFRFVTLEMILRSEVTGSKNILMTIDDANRSVYNAYRDFLKARNIKPVLAVFTDAIGKPNFMTWDQIIEVSSDGWEIASHGERHMPLTDQRFEKTPGDIVNETIRSKQILEEKTGKKIRVFVYPYGQVHKYPSQMVKIAGYNMAFGLNKKPVRLPLGEGEDLFNLPRYMLTRSNVDRIFREISATKANQNSGENKKK